MIANAGSKRHKVRARARAGQGIHASSHLLAILKRSIIITCLIGNYIQENQECRQENQKFKVILSYLKNMRLALVT